MKRFLTRIKLVGVLLLPGLLLAPAMPLPATAQSMREQAEAPMTFRAARRSEPAGPQRKLAPDLEEETNDVTLNRRRDRSVGVIIQLRGATSLSEEGATEGLSVEQRDRVFADDVSANSIRTPAMRARIESLSGRFNRSLNHLGLITAQMPLSKIRDLEDDPEVAYVSPDRDVASAGHIETTVGASLNDARTAVPQIGICDGTGVGIAVLDSGIDDTHNVIKPTATHRGLAYAKTFTSAPANRDAYGHGTHVGTILFGDPAFKSGAYTGIAYDANILSLAVLDSQGKGLSSTVVTAIDWCVTNKVAYNIRVINMSFGAAPKDSYTTDPLCLAARRAHNAGLVVIAAAGNNGKDAQGRKIYGGINSPGIEPSVITVGALNTYGTNLRADDAVASYSSRGPTRAYKVVNGVKRYDNLIKPDLVAPGNRIIGACSPSSVGQANSLVTQNPSLKCGNATTAADQVMYLSGTSMAAPIVAGAAALMIQVNPNLTPSLVKAILTYTAQPMANVNSFEQGAGRLNIEGAVQIASYVLPNAQWLANGATMLTQPVVAYQENFIQGGEECIWGQGIITNYGFLYGSDLINKWQAMYAQGKVLADSTSYVGGLLVRSTTLTSGGVLMYPGAITTTGTLLADGTLLSNGTLLADGTLLAGGVLLADGTLLSDGVLLADGNATSASLTGDNTSCMQPAP
jgi:subtilisin family serine protease